MSLKLVFNPLSVSFDFVKEIGVEDEGTPLGVVDSFDFVGAGVTAALVGGVATVTIPGGGASGGRTFSFWVA